MREDAAHARLWTYAWATTGAAFVAGGVALGSVTKDEGTRIEAYYGAATSSLLPLFVFAWPMRVVGYHERRNGKIDPCVALALEEEELQADAADERLRTGALAHAVNLGTSVVLALPLGLIWDRWRGAAINAAASEVVGLIQIWTTPIGALRARDSFVKANGVGVGSVVWTVSGLPGAVGVSLAVTQ